MFHSPFSLHRLVYDHFCVKCYYDLNFIGRLVIT
uniref:Uncharacterized protein n=1 Tax=Arundo donax TaxID=35708 RepID=A0A0A9A788_ARUDO